MYAKLNKKVFMSAIVQKQGLIQKTVQNTTHWVKENKQALLTAAKVAGIALFLVGLATMASAAYLFGTTYTMGCTMESCTLIETMHLCPEFMKGLMLAHNIHSHSCKMLARILSLIGVRQLSSTQRLLSNWVAMNQINHGSPEVENFSQFLHTNQR